MREVMTPEQVADLLQVGAATIYDLIGDGKLAATSMGRGHQIARVDLEAFLAADSTMPTVRDALFRRVLAIGERHPGLSSDDVLDELERLDEEAKKQTPAQRR